MSTIVTLRTILMADDDEDDRLMTAKAWKRCGAGAALGFVRDGEELMDYLRRRGKYSDPASAPRPALILLDLNMPRKDGREALREIRRDQALCAIPIIVLTTSTADEDMSLVYALGANSFISKPRTFQALTDVIDDLRKHWIEPVGAPPEGSFE
ncbi:MAG TPA: response regulator [Blastocatellia bacterium]